MKGVQGNLWTEYVPTPEQAEYMLYPRVLALAEIGWNGTGQKDYADFRQRAEREVDVLQRKGIHAFDLKNERGERPEALQPVKHKAVGAKVQYNLPAHPYYLAGGDGALTDGLRGGWTLARLYQRQAFRCSGRFGFGAVSQPRCVRLHAVVRSRNILPLCVYCFRIGRWAAIHRSSAYEL
mgnify:CR=1 FL=1